MTYILSIFIFVYVSSSLHSMEAEKPVVIEIKYPRIIVFNPQYKTEISFAKTHWNVHHYRLADTVNLRKRKYENYLLKSKNKLGKDNPLNSIAITLARFLNDEKPAKKYFGNNYVCIPGYEDTKDPDKLYFAFIDTMNTSVMRGNYDIRTNRLYIDKNTVDKQFEKPLKELCIRYAENGTISYDFQ